MAANQHLLKCVKLSQQKTFPSPLCVCVCVYLSVLLLYSSLTTFFSMQQVLIDAKGRRLITAHWTMHHRGDNPSLIRRSSALAAYRFFSSIHHQIVRKIANRPNNGSMLSRKKRRVVLILFNPGLRPCCKWMKLRGRRGCSSLSSLSLLSKFE